MSMNKVFLLVASIIILVSIMIILSYLYDARQVRNQKSTASHLRAISNCLQDYFVDHKQYPCAQSINELNISLCPYYWKRRIQREPVIPNQDAWGHQFKIKIWKSDPISPGLDAFAIGSAGRDGKWEREELSDYPENTPTHSFDNDIVLINGVFFSILKD